MREEYKIIIKKSNDAVAELFQSNKNCFTLQELENWFVKHNETNSETMIFAFVGLKDNDCDLFWEFYNSIKSLIKHYKQLPFIKKCVSDFKNLDKINVHDIYAFLLKHETLLSDLYMSSDCIALNKNLKIHQDFEIFVKAPYHIDFQYLNQNIKIPIDSFYHFKKNPLINKNWLIKYFKEIELVSKWETF